MSDDRAAIQDSIRRLLTPGRMIGQSLGVSLRPSLLLLATIAAALLPVGWRIARHFLTEEDLADTRISMTVAEDTAWPGTSGSLVPLDGAMNPSLGAAALDRGIDQVPQVYSRLTRPFRDLFRLDGSIRLFAYNLFGGLWSLAIWAMVGGVIARVAVVELGCHDRIGITEACRFVGRRYPAFALAPLFPMCFVILIVVFSALLGLVMRSDVGVALAGILWIFMALAGLMLAVLLIALMFGWPLMWGTLASERFGDVFEAAQRSWSYTYGRPLRYLCYAIVAVVCGALGWIIVAVFTESVVHLSWWAVAWGAGHERLVRLNGDDVSAVAAFGTNIIALVQGGVRTVVTGYTFSFFWCAASAIYLLLRKDVDQTNFDEVFREEVGDARTLPALDVDDAGVPGPAQGDGADETDEEVANDEPVDESGNGDGSADGERPPDEPQP